MSECYRGDVNGLIGQGRGMFEEHVRAHIYVIAIGSEFALYDDGKAIMDKVKIDTDTYLDSVDITFNDGNSVISMYLDRTYFRLEVSEWDRLHLRPAIRGFLRRLITSRKGSLKAA